MIWSQEMLTEFKKKTKGKLVGLGHPDSCEVVSHCGLDSRFPDD